MQGRSLVTALNVLAHATSHPDIFWTTRNWITPPDQQAVRQSFSWSSDEVLRLVDRFETMDDDAADWYRGGSGENLWSIMVAGQRLRQVLPRAIRDAVETRRDAAATRLLIWYQFLSDEPRDELDQLLLDVPGLLDIDHAVGVVSEVRSNGRFDVFV